MRPEEIFQSFADEGVEYVLVGGLAATAHGASLVTMDTDVCFRQSPGNCERLARALGPLQAKIFPPRPVEIPITGELLLAYRSVHLRTRAGRLDLLASVPGLGAYEEILTGVVKLSVGGLQIPVLSLEQLIQAKSVLDQPKDREHLDQLLAIQRLRQPK